MRNAPHFVLVQGKQLFWSVEGPYPTKQQAVERRHFIEQHGAPGLRVVITKVVAEDPKAKAPTKGKTFIAGTEREGKAEPKGGKL